MKNIPGPNQKGPQVKAIKLYSAALTKLPANNEAKIHGYINSLFSMIILNLRYWWCDSSTAIAK